MRRRWIFGLLMAVSTCALADADFMSVRTKLAKDYSGRGGDPAAKYFHEATFHPHYDGRFASAPLSEEAAGPHLTSLVQSYLSTMNDIGAETWIMHGTLLGWWWNQKILPWDTDLDVQVSEATIHFLANYYNMTEHHFNLPDVDGGRTYLLEINPHYSVRTTRDKLNVIDGRWIDTASGLFIDITTVRSDDLLRARGIQTALMCKDGHRYDENDIFPLRDTQFEGIAAKVPYAYTKLLEREYGRRSLALTTFQGHKWNPQTKLWEKTGNSNNGKTEKNS